MPSTFESRLREHLADDEFDESITKFMKQYSKLILASPKSSESKDSKDVDYNNREKNEYSLQSYEIWKDYLEVIERHLSVLQKAEGLTSVEFKEQIANIEKTNPMLVRLMIASWEFQQFIEICKEYNEAIDDVDNDDVDDDIAESKINHKDDNDSKDFK